MRIVTEPGVAGDASRAEIACELCFYLVKSEEVYLVLLFCSMTALVPAYKLRALHLITWRSAPGCWGHYGHWCSLLAAGPFGQTDKQESISAPYSIDRGIIVIIFPSSVSVSLFKVLFYLFISFGQRMPPSGLDKWRQMYEDRKGCYTGQMDIPHFATLLQRWAHLLLWRCTRCSVLGPAGGGRVKNRTLYSIIISCGTRPQPATSQR